MTRQCSVAKAVIIGLLCACAALSVAVTIMVRR